MAAPTNPTEIVDALAERLASTFPPGKRMSENGNGQYAALNARVEDLRGNYQELRHDMDTRFTKLSSDIAEQARSTNERLDSIVTAIANKGNGDFTKYAGVFAVIVAIASGVIGGFIKLENDSIGDKIGQQGAALTDKIAASTATQAANHARLELRVGNLEANTVPRLEADKRIGANEHGVADVRRTQDDHTKTIAGLVSDMAYIKADVERFKTIAVSRSEIDGSKNDLIGRINLLSNRISDMSKDNSALPLVIENQKQIRSDLNELTRKFVTVPSYQK